MTPALPGWLHGLSVASLLLAFACAGFIVFDETQRPQKMAVMAWVWPLCALFGSVIWLGFYLRFGRGEPKGSDEHEGHAQHHGGAREEGDKPPFAVSVSTGASHCGAGCTLGDIVAEGLAIAFPAVAVAFGWKSLFAEKMFAVWGLDLLFAYGFGIVFQYFALKPMSDRPARQVLWRALKADTLSILSWQVGMYGAMTLLQFLWIRPAFGALAPAASPEFWLLMQVAMLAGFVTAWPVNAWLIKSGVKEAM